MCLQKKWASQTNGTGVKTSPKIHHVNFSTSHLQPLLQTDPLAMKQPPPKKNLLPDGGAAGFS